MAKEMIISLRDLSHEVCVAATQESYWHQLTVNSNVRISAVGSYVPVELKLICNDERLQLIIQGEHSKVDKICAQIRCDLLAFEHNDRPIYDSLNEQTIVYGSLYNSLPLELFDIERHFFGQGQCQIKNIRRALNCMIMTQSISINRWRMTVHHKDPIVMNLAVIQIQTFVKQAQYQYVFAFAMKIGRPLAGTDKLITNSSSSSDSTAFPGFTSFEPPAKRKREDDVRMADDSDASADESELDEKCEQRRVEVEELLMSICERMQSRMPKDEQAKIREDSSQMRSYFRNTSLSKTSIELVEHEKDLRSRKMNKHKCTLVFNKLLKMGEGSCDSLKKTAKFLAYEKLKTMTRDIPQEKLVLKLTRDGLWKVVINNQ